MTEALPRLFPPGHPDEIRVALEHFHHELATIERWGTELALRLADGRRVITLGNGASADHAEHLAAELGRRLARHAARDVVALAVDRDTGPAALEHAIGDSAGQVGGGDVVVAFSPNGSSSNVLAAGRVALERGALLWSFTGPVPNPLASSSSEVVAAATGSAVTIRELHQLALRLLCEAFEDALASRGRLEPTMAEHRSGRALPAAGLGPW